MGFNIFWTPVFTCLREAASAKAGRGDEYSVIFFASSLWQMVRRAEHPEFVGGGRQGGI
jgi:hypothetical protein